MGKVKNAQLVLTRRVCTYQEMAPAPPGPTPVKGSKLPRSRIQDIRSVNYQYVSLAAQAHDAAH